MPRAYRAKNGAEQFKPVLGEDFDALDFEDGIGFCLACGALAEGVEPDARCYVCESCGRAKVYGLAELALMGLVAAE